uniref:CCHC-type domain-containing protein n=1 Tax=Pogona vitticeps TaxID=103695 RepID=A0ABM5FAW1_9SAUR
MEGLSFPGELPWWGPESYPPGPRVSTEASRGGLGPPSLLWDHMCRAECPTTTVNRSRTIRAGPLVREELNPAGVKAKGYTLLSDEVLKDPFDPVELSVHSNKVVISEEMDSPPCLFPAFTTQPPPAEDGPCHSGAQRAAGGTRSAGNEEVTKLQEAMERQARLIENLTEQQILMARQMRGKENEDERGARNLASIRGSLVAGPTPIRMQKMTNTDDPEAYLHTFERVATAAGWPRDQWTLVLIPCLTGLLQEVVDTLGVQEATRYDAVKNAILSTLNLTEETYRKRLRELKWKPGTHPRTVAQRMRANAMRWLKPSENDGEKIVDAVMLEQLVQSLGTNAKNWVQKNNPKTLERAITLLEDYSNRGSEQGSDRPGAEKHRPRGGEVSLSTSNLTAKAGTDMNGSARPRRRGFEPFTPKPVRPITVDQRIYAPGTGWKEGKDGRPIYNPRAVGRDNKEGRPICFSCGVPGHVRKNCPGTDCSLVGRLTQPVEPKVPSSERWEIHAWVNGVKKKALIDTGCWTTLVRDLPGKRRTEDCPCDVFVGTLRNTKPYRPP